MHCMFSCRPGAGKHMGMDTVKAALKLAQDHGHSVFIGGGEPTLHPQFWEIVGLCLKVNAEPSWSAGMALTGLVTNGSQTDDALALARLAEQGMLMVSLSRDQYHRCYSIDDCVVKAFTKNLQPRHRETRDGNDLRDLRGYIINIIPAGRAKRLLGGKIEKGSSGCSCGDYHVNPDGTIYQCGCRKVSVGNVFDGFDEGIDAWGEWNCSSAGFPPPRIEEEEEAVA